MEIKTWHKVAFFGSIAAFVIYVKRDLVKRGIGFGLSKIEAAQKLIAEYAIQWVGTLEVGKNNGWANKTFQKMMQEVGWSNSDQWCMYFAKMVHYNTFPKDRDKINEILNGQSQTSYDNARDDKSGTYTVSKTPQVGDIIIFVHSNATWKGHAGVVTKVNNNNMVETIEGNTSDKSISDGDLVAKKIRPSIIGKSIGGDLVLRGFIRKVNLLT